MGRFRPVGNDLCSLGHRGRDKAVKAADVEILEITAGNETGGKSLLKLNGPVGDIEYALEEALVNVTRKGRLVRTLVIPVPHSDIKGYVSGN